MIRSLVLALTLSACTAPGAAGIPGFVLQEMKGAHALRAKLYVATDGHLRKFTMYVNRDAIPDWVHSMADEKIGSGADSSYEIEQYENGDQVYEISRIVNDHPVELSVRTDKSVKYIETWLDPEVLPDPIKATMAEVAGFVLERASIKQGPGLMLYQLRGKKNDVEQRYVFSEAGELMHDSRALPAKLELDF
jgi:hypothetical protein